MGEWLPCSFPCSPLQKFSPHLLLTAWQQFDCSMGDLDRLD